MTGSTSPNLFEAARAQALANIRKARRDHRKVRPHLKALQDATTAALRWETGARHGQ